MHSSRIATTVLLSSALVCVGCAELPAQRAAPGDEPYTRRDVAAPTVQVSTALPRLALVLSAGSMRGFAHLGVLKVLEEAGIRPDLVVGTSAGSIVGGLYASGMPVEALIEASRTVDFDLGTSWLRANLGLGSSPVYDFVSGHVRETRIESFPIPFAAVAADLQRGCMRVFNGGSSAVAIQASTAVPGIFAPTHIAGHDYVDGGLVSPLPVRVAHALGAERVIAVNVVFDPSESRLKTTIDRLFQTALVMTRTLAAEEARHADLVIEPQLPPEAEVTLANRDALIAAGERAARAALPQLRALLQSDGARRVSLGEARRDPRWCDPIGPMQTAGGTRAG